MKVCSDVLQRRLYGSNRTTSWYQSKQMKRAMLQIHCLEEDLENNLFLLLFSIWKTITHPNYSLWAESAAGSVPPLARSDTLIPSCFLPPLWSYFLLFRTLLFLSQFCTHTHTHTHTLWHLELLLVPLQASSRNKNLCLFVTTKWRKWKIRSVDLSLIRPICVVYICTVY